MANSVTYDKCLILAGNSRIVTGTYTFNETGTHSVSKILPVRKIKSVSLSVPKKTNLIEVVIDGDVPNKLTFTGDGTTATTGTFTAIGY